MLKGFCRGVDLLNEWTAKIAAWLIMPLCLLVTFDVILRYVFNRPTVWAWDINVQFLGALAALSGGYTLLEKGHIGVDVFVVDLTPKKQVMVELITSLFFFVGVGVLLWQSGVAAWFSVRTKEVDYTFFAPPLYPLKVIIALGFFLLFLQGMAKFIRNLAFLVSGKEGAR